MDEEKETQSPQEQTEKESQNSTNKVFQEAKELAERLERANKETRELLDRKEHLLAEEVLGGKSSSEREEKKEITEKDYAESVLRGEPLFY